MNLLLEFVSNVQNTYREDGYALLKVLPALIVEASARWGIEENTGRELAVSFAEMLSSL
jgi:hypothetical protein